MDPCDFACGPDLIVQWKLLWNRNKSRELQISRLELYSLMRLSQIAMILSTCRFIAHNFHRNACWNLWSSGPGHMGFYVTVNKMALAVQVLSNMVSYSGLGRVHKSWVRVQVRVLCLAWVRVRIRVLKKMCEYEYEYFSLSTSTSTSYPKY